MKEFHYLGHINYLVIGQLKGKGTSFQWGDTQRQSFETPKVAIAATPTRKVVDPN